MGSSKDAKEGRGKRTTKRSKKQTAAPSVSRRELPKRTALSIPSVAPPSSLTFPHCPTILAPGGSSSDGGSTLPHGNGVLPGRPLRTENEIRKVVDETAKGYTRAVNAVQSEVTAGPRVSRVFNLQPDIYRDMPGQSHSQPLPDNAQPSSSDERLVAHAYSKAQHPSRHALQTETAMKQSVNLPVPQNVSSSKSHFNKSPNRERASCSVVSLLMTSGGARPELGVRRHFRTSPEESYRFNEEVAEAESRLRDIKVTSSAIMTPVAPGLVRFGAPSVDTHFSEEQVTPVADVAPTRRPVSRSGVTNGRSRVVYDSRSGLTRHREIDSDCLSFESRFESGNLCKAVRVGPHAYDLTLSPDTKTSALTQWFYFKIRNAISDTLYTFRIVNMYKQDSLYSRGLQPLVRFRSREASGWQRMGSKVSWGSPYGRSKWTGGLAGTRCALSFQIMFPEENDVIEIAHCYPYTYTQLCNDLSYLSLNGAVCRQQVLCRSEESRDCHYCCITDFSTAEADLPFNEIGKRHNRKDIVITGRVHPGESNASWIVKTVCQGILETLCNDSAASQWLRSNTVIHVVPMLNIDGVVRGNYRCCLAGHDLNRRWKDPDRELHPTIFATKQLIMSLKQKCALFCDVHGHSTKKNAFIFGCDASYAGNDSGSWHPQDIERKFPSTLAGLCDAFSMKDSAFDVYKEKEGSARVCIWRELQLPASYTLEASFYGCDDAKEFGPYAGRHFDEADLMNIGNDFCVALKTWLDSDT